MCSTLFYIEFDITFFKVTWKTPMTDANGQYLKLQKTKFVQNFIALQVHMNVVFLFDTSPNVSWGLVQI